MTQTAAWRLVIAAGGTGGHVMPAMAVAKRLQAEGYLIHWLGTEQGMGRRLSTEAGFSFKAIKLSGFKNQGIFKQCRVLLETVQAFLHCFFWFLFHRFDLVLGVGGYVTVPGGMAAALLRMPLVIHEQNAVPGLANRWLSLFARKRLCGFPEVWPGAMVTGNPLREAIERLPMPSIPREVRPLKILILGGSQGASRLNHLIPKVVGRFPIQMRPKVWHQTGLKDFETVRTEYIQANVDAKVAPFIEEISQAYQWADFVVARSGAMTVSEIAAAGLPSILIPYPHAADNHQWYNAQKLAKVRAATILEERDLQAERLYSELEVAYHRLEERGQMALAARKQAKLYATQEVVTQCLELLNVGAKPVSIPS